MFILSDKFFDDNKIKLVDINKITIIYYINELKTNSSIDINIYNIKYNFNINIIPLITSVLEISPIYSKHKTYNCLNYTFTTKYLNKIINIVNKFNHSFLKDIDFINNNNNFLTYTRYSIHKFVDNQDNQIINFYNDKKLNNFIDTDTIYNEYEYEKITWLFEWGEFEIIITYKNNICFYTYCININIIEDIKLIQARTLEINNILTKINKIKSLFNIN